MPCDSMDDQELVGRVLELRRELQPLDQRYEDIYQRLKVPLGEAHETTEEENTLERRHDELWERQQHFMDEVSRRGLDEILVKAVQADDAQRKQERHDD